MDLYRSALRIGTRTSPLAMRQAHEVAATLEGIGIATELCGIRTKGDAHTERPIHALGSSAVFVKELEEALLSGVIDIAAHSAKDMPSSLEAPFEVVAFTKRLDVADVLLARHADFSLNKAHTIGTSAVRRIALLKRHYPHLTPSPLRGNIDTRIARLKQGEYDAIMVAAAGLERLKTPLQQGLYAHRLDPTSFTPAPGQGCIAVEVLATHPSAWKKKLHQALNHKESEQALRAERAFVKQIGGGCATPQYAWARLIHNHMHLTAGICTIDGKKWLEDTQIGNPNEAEQIGFALGEKILHLGAKALLAT